MENRSNRFLLDGLGISADPGFPVAGRLFEHHPIMAEAMG
jgi:hypothetical protein